jgi:D-amino peptidase
MKVYLSADIEGVTGVTHWDEASLSKADSEVAREQMTAEVVAACEGAIEAGATEIWVKDAHASGRNLIASKLPHEVRLIRGWSGHPFLMVQELDESFAGVVLIGYHSRAGVGSNPLAHTITGRITHLKINERYGSEFLIHAYAAASVRVPVVFVSGDKGLCEDVAQLNPHMGTVAVKEGIGDSTVNLHPELAVARIRKGVAEALRSDVARCQILLPGDFSIQIRYRDHFQAFRCGYYPGARQVDAHTVQFDAQRYFEVLRFLLFVT